MAISQEAQTLCDIIKSLVTGGRVNYNNLPMLVAKAMEVAQQMSHLSGEEKKDAVVKGICMAIDASDMAGPFEGVLLELVPVLYDTIIEVDKGKIRINKKLRGGVLSGCCRCF